jgi:hypothetical protein
MTKSKDEDAMIAILRELRSERFCLALEVARSKALANLYENTRRRSSEVSVWTADVTGRRQRGRDHSTGH